ncbi:nitroreductase family protein [Bdellovibrio reynosensis]|uniref:Nitroreductase domain-containing protein n=1 Tax=Bdellovibrio reynosensis TaxID=2835041 RepID=A0ABY4C7C7_9BACT|nr:hypothetical protein [Bdellovibrio reynosensis]UOF00830.1 hypothetical protein MNR06_14105 [Bdellovibrio reynosensis]
MKMSRESQNFRNQYLCATSEKDMDGTKIFSLEVLTPFPIFFTFPLLDISAQLLSAEANFAILMPNNSVFCGVLLALGYKEQVSSEGLLFFIEPASLRHPISFGMKEYFQFASLQERSYFGLSHSDWKFSPTSHILPKFELPNKNRNIHSFADLIAVRKSAVAYKNTTVGFKGDYDLLLRDCYYLNEKGKFPVATAGGFQHFEIYFATSGLKDLDRGLYRIFSYKSEWEKISTDDYTKAIWESAFSQEYTKDCTNYFLFVLKLSEMSPKYGSRSHRFAFLGLGGLLDRLHLSSTSYGASYRTIGGFDEAIIKTILRITDENRIIGAVGAIGFD